MKTLVRNLLMLAAVLSVSVNAFAIQVTIDGIKYAGGGGLECYVDDVEDRSFSGAYIIPSTIEYGNYTYTVTSIGTSAFRSSQLSSVYIPSSVTGIGAEAFMGCPNLTSVVLEEGVTIIGDSAFRECVNLTSIELPQSISIIYQSAFQESGLTSINLENIKEIGYDVFYQCKNLTTVKMPQTITSIGGCFGYCENLIEINLPSNLTVVPVGMFSNCASLTHIDLPSSVTSIQDNAFRNTPLSDIYLHEGITEIGRCAFEGTSLTKISIPRSVTAIDSNAFLNCKKLTHLEFNAERCQDFSHYPPFEGCDQLSEISFGETVYQIPAYFGRFLPSLNSINLPPFVEKIGDNAFSHCDNLSSANMDSHSLRIIEDHAFFACPKLQHLVLGPVVESIGDSAFSSLYSLETVHSLNIWPATCGSNVFGAVNSNATLYVPDNSVQTYRNSASWDRFSNIYPITTSGVDKISENEAIKVYGKNGNIMISGNSELETTEVYNLSGQLVYGGTETTINVPAKGIYIVKVAGQTFKVAL